jgi:hypothetical protein
MANKFIILAADKTKQHQHLFMEVWYLDKKRLFVVDSGSDASYLYFMPLKVQTLESAVDKEFGLGMEENEGGVNITPVIWDHDMYYHMDKPTVIKELEKQYKLEVSGVIGLDYLIKNKVALDFAQL